MRLSLLAVLLAVGLSACATTPGTPKPDELALEAVGFERVPGWRTDQLAPALAAFRAGCGRITDDPASWQPVCAAAQDVAPGNERAARAFFEHRFKAFQMTDNGVEQGLFTGYYEPEVEGSRVRAPGYGVPIYMTPRGVRGPLPSRAAIDRGALANRHLELFWLSDPIDAFFLEIQGSGRVHLPDGRVVRVSYDGQNGHSYVAIGRVLIDRGELTRDEVSLQTIRAWLLAHPDQAQEVMEKNPAYVFFRELGPIPAERGPPGAAGVALTPWRSIAVDRSFIPLGAPVFVNTTNALDGAPIQRLMVAQDTGGAIKGPVRADLFLGVGARGGGACRTDEAARHAVPAAAARPLADRCRATACSPATAWICCQSWTRHLST